MVQLNATYKNIEESIGRLLPQQTKEQLSLLEALVRWVLLSSARVPSWREPVVVRSIISFFAYPCAEKRVFPSWLANA